MIFDRVKAINSVKKLVSRNKSIYLVIDVDGVLTDGGFYYSESGKLLKKFGPHDSDAIKLLPDNFRVKFISADARGFKISASRISDMGFQLELISATKRVEFVRELKVLGGTIFIGDSFTDVLALQEADLAVVPKNGHRLARKSADLVLKSKGGNGAVADLCLLIIDSIGNYE
jgi:3-deoxy-D-manno-octulosonate 8-phosphate phosphatase (KDO 8-P phosphatase)